MKKLNLKLTVFTAILIFIANISNGQHEHNEVDTTKTDKTKDVVCGKEITKNDSLKVTYNDKDYFFCSDKDMLAFLKHPQKYTNERIQDHSEHKTEEHSHGMMGMSTPLIIIMGVVMVTAMIVGMSGAMR